MASNGRSLQEFLAETADLEEEEAFVERYPFPFLVQEEVRKQPMDEPVPGVPAGDRGTMRVTSTAIPRGLGDGSLVFAICPKDPEHFEGAVTLGRGEECDVVVDDASISTHHASFTLEVSDGGDRMVRVHDEGSTNGTFVDGDKIDGSAIVEDSTSVRFGPGCKFQYFTPGSLHTFLSFYRRMKKR
jgi:hypothetical protein